MVYPPDTLLWAEILYFETKALKRSANNEFAKQLD